jgi:hypothetical protein
MAAGGGVNGKIMAAWRHGGKWRNGINKRESWRGVSASKAKINEIIMAGNGGGNNEENGV